MRRSNMKHWDRLLIGFAIIAFSAICWAMIIAGLVMLTKNPAIVIVARILQLIGFLTICYFVGMAACAFFRRRQRAARRKTKLAA
jgi:mannitol-specific phosphotransferase system IIBC component